MAARFIVALARPGLILGLCLALGAVPAAAGRIGFHVGFHGGHYGFFYGFSHFGHHPRRHYYRRHHHGRHYHRRHHHAGHRVHFHYRTYRHGYGHRHYTPYRRANRSLHTAPRVVAVFSGGDGWALLREGRAREAQAAFGGAAARQPRDGGVKAGFAIAAAASGELEMAAWSMRRALKVDAKALAHLPVDESLSRTLLTLIDEFAISEGGRVEMRDAAFMRAALHYLLGEPGAARRALALAVEMGEDNPGADALQRLIAETSSVG